MIGAVMLVRAVQCCNGCRSRRRCKVFVLDEVSRPATLTLTDGRMNRCEALAEQIVLERHDVVFVDASSLVRWSRVVNLPIPSAAPGTLTARAVTP